MVAGQEKQHRYCDGVVDGCFESSELDDLETPSPAVAAFVDVEQLKCVIFGLVPSNKGAA